MRHTSGLAYASEIPDAELRAAAAQADFAGQMPYVDVQTFLDALAAAPLAAQPGTAFRYGYSTDVPGMIVAKLDGLPLGLALKTRIFERLGMHDSGFEVPSAAQGRLAAAYAEDAAWQARVAGYGLRKPDRPLDGKRRWRTGGDAGDYACFARMLANGGSYVTKVAVADLFREMCRNQLPGIDGGRLSPRPASGRPGGPARLALAAMPPPGGRMVWSGISGTAFRASDQRWSPLLHQP